jgi:hypothetical protein
MLFAEDIDDGFQLFAFGSKPTKIEFESANNKKAPRGD